MIGPSTRAIWVAVIVGSFATPSGALAYRTTADDPSFGTQAPAAWETSPIPYGLHGDVPAHLGEDATKDAIRRGLAAWTTPGCTNVAFRDARDGRAARTGDGLVTFQWLGDDWSARGYAPDVLAVTDIEYERRDGMLVIVDADVILNKDGFFWTDSSGSGPGSLALVEAVVTHEVGHVLGFLHEDDASSAMYELYESGETLPLTEDDVLGLCTLYPTDACAGDECADRCGDSAPCDEGERCSGGRCVPEPDCVVDADCGPDEGCTSGRCLAAERGFGAACDTGDACASGICLTTPAPAMCTDACDGAASCPDGFLCKPAGGRHVCVPKSDGCAVAGTTTTTSWMWVLLGLSVVFSRRRRAE